MPPPPRISETSFCCAPALFVHVEDIVYVYTHFYDATPSLVGVVLCRPSFLRRPLSFSSQTVSLSSLCQENRRREYTTREKNRSRARRLARQIVSDQIVSDLPTRFPQKSWFRFSLMEMSDTSLSFLGLFFFGLVLFIDLRSLLFLFFFFSVGKH